MPFSVAVTDASSTAASETQVDATAAAPAATEPQMVDVWRPGGRSDERRPRHDRNRHRHQDRPQEGAQATSAEGDPAKRERPGQGRRDRKDFSRFKRPDTDATPARTEGAPPREQGEGKGRPPREHFHGKGRDKGKFQRPQKGGRDGRQDSGPSHRPFASSAPPRERDRPIDPNSPFAKLAALKEQLAAANRKD